MNLTGHLMNIISFVATKNELDLNKVKQAKLDEISELIEEYLEILNDLLAMRLTKRKRLEAANWMLYQISLQTRVRDKILRSTTREEIDAVVNWGEQCEEIIQARRPSELSPTVADIIFGDGTENLVHN